MYMTNRRPVVLGFLTLVGVALLTCFCGTNAERGLTDEGQWQFVFEDSEKSHFSIDARALDRSTPDKVRVRVKFVPSEGAFQTSMKHLSKEFGQVARPQEHTVSMWEFDCVTTEGRCLSLTHFREGKKIATYEYPDQKWSPLSKGNSTRMLQELLCKAPEKTGG
jgi:hypothetical protein